MLIVGSILFSLLSEWSNLKTLVLDPFHGPLILSLPTLKLVLTPKKNLNLRLRVSIK